MKSIHSFRNLLRKIQAMTGGLDDCNRAPNAVPSIWRTVVQMGENLLRVIFITLPAQFLSHWLEASVARPSPGCFWILLKSKVRINLGSSRRMENSEGKWKWKSSPVNSDSQSHTTAWQSNASSKYNHMCKILLIFVTLSQWLWLRSPFQPCSPFRCICWRQS